MSLILACVLIQQQAAPISVRVSMYTYSLKSEAVLSLAKVTGFATADFSFLSVDELKFDRWLKRAVNDGLVTLVSSPKLNTLDGMPATMSIGNDTGGYSIGVLVKVKHNAFDVSAATTNRLLKTDELASSGWTSRFVGPLRMGEGRTLLLTSGDEHNANVYLTTVSATLGSN